MLKPDITLNWINITLERATITLETIDITLIKRVDIALERVVMMCNDITRAKTDISYNSIIIPQKAYYMPIILDGRNVPIKWYVCGTGTYHLAIFAVPQNLFF